MAGDVLREALIVIKTVGETSGLTKAEKAAQKVIKATETADKKRATEAEKAAAKQAKAFQKAAREREKAAKLEKKAIESVRKTEEDARDSQLTKLAAIGAAIAAAFAVDRVRALVVSTVAWADELSATAARIGVSSTELQRLQFIAERSDVSTEALASGMQKLAVNLGGAARSGSTGAKMFRRLGIDVRNAAGNIRPTGDVLVDAANKIAGMGSQAERSAAAVELFGRGGVELLPLLQQGGAAVAALTAEYAALGIEVDATTVQTLASADDAFIRAKLSLRAFAADIVVRLVPAIQWMQEKISAVVRWFRTGQNTIKVFGVIALSALAALTAVVQIYSASWAVAAVATWTAVAPILAAVAAGILLGLAIDDLVSFAQGGDSLIGRLLGPEASQMLRDVIEFFQFLVRDLLPQGSTAGQSFGLVVRGALTGILAAVRFIIGGWVQLVNTFRELDLVNGFSTMRDAIKLVFTDVYAIITRSLTDPIGAAVDAALRLIGYLAALPGIGDGVRAAADALGLEIPQAQQTSGRRGLTPADSPTVGAPARVPARVRAPASLTQQTTRTANVNGGDINITVNGATDPQVTASAVSRAAGRSVQQQNRAALALTGARGAT